MDALLLLLLPAAACGLMMAGCMWLMRRGMTSHRTSTTSTDASDAASAAELAALRDEVARLRQSDGAPASDAEEAR